MKQKQIIVNNLLRNYAIQEGDTLKIPLIFLHGRGQTHKSFDCIIKDFPDHPIVVPDFPWFGSSHTPFAAWTVQEYAKNLAAFLKALEIKKASFIIHSFGGRVVIDLYHLQSIQIEKIIFIASWGYRPPITVKGKIFLAIKKITDLLWLTKLMYNTPIENYVQLVFASRDYAYARGIMKDIVKLAVNYDQSKMLHTVQVPSLLIRWEKDEETPIADAHFFHKEIQASQLAIHPEGSHFVFQEYPEWTNNLIKKFLHDHS